MTQTETPNPFNDPPPFLTGESLAVPDTAEAKPVTAFQAWRSITSALGRDLQSGLSRADAARRRMAKGF